MSAHADMTSRDYVIGYDNDVKIARAASSLCEVQPFTLDLKISYI